MIRNVLITGGTGLLALNWALAISNKCNVTLGFHSRILNFSRFKHIQINLECVDELVKLLEEIEPDVVIHTAGMTNVEQCEKMETLAHFVNVTLAENVAKACSITKLLFVHISTDHLFSGENSFIGEDEKPNPLNIYGKTKAEAENRVFEAYPKSLVIRTNFFGWGTTYRKSFSDVIINSLRKNSNLKLFKDVFYTPTLIDTLALAVHDLIDIRANGIFNVVGDERISKYHFGLKIAERFNLEPNKIKKTNYSNEKYLVKRPLDMSLSNNKVCNILGRPLGNVEDHIVKFQSQEFKKPHQTLRKL